MHTGTLLEIIAMLEAGIDHHQAEIEKNDPSREGRIGAHLALSEFRDHLQSYIEDIACYGENQSTEQ